jgi:hypothetical protein
MWKSRNKTDLIIEVWEKLDCENVGRPEIEAIETAVGEVFGTAAVDSPMVIARLLADEGAELRHSEIMTLYVERAADRPYDAVFRNAFKLDDLQSAVSTIRNLENLRKKFYSENDKKGLRLLRDSAVIEKKELIRLRDRPTVDALDRRISDELVQWLSVWLQTPELFEDWVQLRQGSREFIETFGNVRPDLDK